MNPAEQQLLRAVCLYPEDDFPRLVYADWLEEQGQPERAEFVRVQMELTATPDLIFWPSLKAKKLRRDRLLYTQQGLFAALDFACFGHDKPLQGLRLSDETFAACDLPNKGLVRRGFVEVVHCAAAVWRDHGPAIVAAQPVANVRLTDREPNDYGPLDDGIRFGWLIEGEPGHTGRSCLPRRIAEALWKLQVSLARWPTAEAAHVDLSRACLAWARSVAFPELRAATQGR